MGGYEEGEGAEESRAGYPQKNTKTLKRPLQNSRFAPERFGLGSIRLLDPRQILRICLGSAAANSLEPESSGAKATFAEVSKMLRRFVSRFMFL